MAKSLMMILFSISHMKKDDDFKKDREGTNENAYLGLSKCTLIGCQAWAKCYTVKNDRHIAVQHVAYIMNINVGFALHYSVDFIFLSLGIMGFINNLKLLEGH